MVTDVLRVGLDYDSNVLESLKTDAYNFSL